MERVVGLDELKRLGERLRTEGRRIVLTNGHFDLLHVGHLRYLEAAKSLGDVLIVGVNDDAMTTARKGDDRPLVAADERAELLAGLRCVDYVTIFSAPTAIGLVEALRPDVYVKGGDYGPGGTPLPEAPAVVAHGGEVVIIPTTAERSTTALVAAIRAHKRAR